MPQSAPDPDPTTERRDRQLAWVQHLNDLWIATPAPLRLVGWSAAGWITNQLDTTSDIVNMVRAITWW